MEQVIRVLHGRRQRQLQRAKIKELTPQELFNNFHYHQQEIMPHLVLRHQYQHLRNYSFNELEHITERKLFPLSSLFAYEPTQNNQMQQEHLRSKSISQHNQFLRKYNQREHEDQKKEYFRKYDAREFRKKEIQKIEKPKYNDLFPQDSESQQSDLSSLHIPVFRDGPARKFRNAARAVYFCALLKKRLRRFISIRREKCFRYGKMYVQQACLSMQTHYYALLQQQITQYILLLEKVSRYPRYNPDQDILRILSFMSTKLTNSAIPKSLLMSLELVGVNYSFYNFPFLFDSVLDRLEVDEQWGCLVGVGKDESMMISASLMGIVMLCFNLLYRPWLAEGLFRKKQKREFNIHSKYDRVKNVIHAMGSLVYFYCIDHFIFNIDPFERNYRQFSAFLQSKNIQTVKQMSISPKTQKEEEEPEQGDSQEEQDEAERSLPTAQSARLGPNDKDSTGIFVDQNRHFYNRIKQSHPYELTLIGDNISQWITKATLASLSESEKARRVRASKFRGIK